MLIRKIRNKKFVLILFLFLFSFLISSSYKLAQAQTDEWRIKEFKTTIEIFNDDSALIREDLVADAGNTKGKHGIFRIVPTRANTPKGYIYSPVELVSISDFFGNAYKYQETDDAGTITWKIGDPNITVSGENDYRIVYKLSNIIRDQDEFDEFYFNIPGNYWDMEIDSFKAEIILPENINKSNISLHLYSGQAGEKDNTIAKYRWLDDSRLELSSSKKLEIGESASISLSFPKGNIEHQIIDTSNLTTRGSEEKDTPWYMILNALIVTPITIGILFTLRRKKQKQNPYYKRTVIAEYDSPDNLSPIMLAYINKRRSDGKYFTASIVHMAVLGLITIDEKEYKTLFFKNKELKFIKSQDQKNYQQLDKVEKHIFDHIFKENNSIDSKKLGLILQKEYHEINELLKNQAKHEGYLLERNSFATKGYIIAIFLSLLSVSILSFVALAVFLLLDRNLSEKGEKIIWQTKGFKHYLSVAEKDRHAFYEKENIFTKLLPYSIVLGVVKEWTKKMADIYGEEYVQNSLYWYSGTSGLKALASIDNISSQINSITSNINSSMGTSSGGGGGGFSGGGSGGGGGGGW